MKNLITAVVFATSIVPFAASADQVHLTNGETLDGVARRVGDEVVITLDIGEVRLPANDVASIDRTPSALAELERRYVALDPNDTKGLYRLGLLAEKARLTSRARAIFRRVLEVDTNHKGARAALGYRRVGDRWLTEEEELTAKGFVHREGVWVSREVAGEMDRAQAAQRAERRDAEASARIAKLEKEVAAARREAAEAKSASGRQPYTTSVWPWPYVVYRAPACVPGQTCPISSRARQKKRRHPRRAQTVRLIRGRANVLGLPVTPRR